MIAAYESWAARSILVAENFEASPKFWETVGSDSSSQSDAIALTQDYGFDLMYWGWRERPALAPEHQLVRTSIGDRAPTERFSEITSGQRVLPRHSVRPTELSQPALARILAGYPVAAQGDGYILYALDAKP